MIADIREANNNQYFHQLDLAIDPTCPLCQISNRYLKRIWICLSSKRCYLTASVWMIPMVFNLLLSMEMGLCTEERLLSTLTLNQVLSSFPVKHTHTHTHTHSHTHTLPAVLKDKS